MSAYYKASVDGDSYYDRSSMQRHSRPTKAFIWGIREHKGRLAPVHARQIMPHSSTGVYTPFVSKEITFRSTALFVSWSLMFHFSHHDSSVKLAISGTDRKILDTLS